MRRSPPSDGLARRRSTSDRADSRGKERQLPFDESAGVTAPPAFGTFRVLHQIGSGVLGPVFRTYEPQHDRLVAVKAFRLDIVPEQIARLADALRRLVASRLSHPAVVPVLDAGLEGTTAYLAMEYVAAETLDVALRHLAPAPLERALPILSQLAEAIDAAWSAGSGHGALHPRDVFVTLDSHDIRVTGFGILPTLELVGIKAPVRRSYAAPERVNGESWDIRADVYSLGAIAHELLTRRRPAGSGEQDGALTSNTTAEQRVLIRRVLASVLAERPAARFVSGRAFVEALSAIARGEAVNVPPLDEPAPSSSEAAQSGEPDDEPLTIVTLADGFLSESNTPGTHSPVWVASPGAHSKSAGNADGEARVPVGAAHDPEPLAAPGRADSASRASAVAAAVVIGADAVRARPREPSRWQPGPPDHIVVPDAPPSPAFPWSAIAAVGVASLVLGIAIGYQYARYTAANAPAAVNAARSGDTDVTVPDSPPASPVASEAAGARASAGSGSAVESPTVPAPKTPLPPVAQIAATPGRLIVRSTPAGALLVVDGRRRGQTPFTVRDLTLGPHTVELARPGFVPHKESVTLSPRSTVRNLLIQLQPGERPRGRESRPAITGSSAASSPAAALGSVFVDSRPQAARVSIDGRFIGVTPLRIPEVKAGSHAVRLELAGHKPFATTVDVKPAEQARVTAALEEQQAPND